MGNLSHTVGGTDNLVSFKSAARVPIDSLKVHFKPIQEGEGYPSPENVRPIRGWNEVEAYRSGKNIARVTGYNAVNTDNADLHDHISNAYGTTISTNNYSLPDTSVVITQTQATSETAWNYGNGYFAVMVKNLIYGCYYDVSFKITDVTNNILNCNLNNICVLVPSGSAYPVSEIKDNVFIYKNIQWKRNNSRPNRSNFEIRNCGMSFTLSEFMVTPAGMNDGVFEPYCGEVIPVTLPVTGKNKFNGEISNANIASNGQISSNVKSRISTSLISIAHGQYTLSSSENHPVSIYAYDDNGFIANESLVSWQESPTTFVVENAKYVRFKWKKTDDSAFDPSEITNIQLELGSEATAYEPYNSDNTVYGGYVDLAKGEVVQNWNKYILTGDETFYKSGNWVTTFVPVGMRAHDLVESTRGVGFCSHYPYSPYSRGKIGVMYGEKTITFDGSIRDADGWKSYCQEQYANGTPITICYPLKNPISYPLTSTKLKAFLGNNSFWSNTNDVTEVSYAIHDTAPIRAAKKQMMAASPHIETASDDLVNFNTDVAAPLKECKVYFEPVQEGEGDPSPENIRPIKGWTSVDVYKSGKNLIRLPVMTRTIKGITWTVSEDGSIQVDGTATDNTWMSYWHDDSQHVDFYLKAGAYALSRNGTPPVAGIYLSARDGSTTTDIGRVGRTIDSITFTLKQDTLVGFQAVVTPDLGEIHTTIRPQLELLSSTDYEAPNNSVIPITFPAEAGTIYGGYVDLVNGEIVQEYELVEDTWGNIKHSSVNSTTGYQYGRLFFKNPVVKAGMSGVNNVSYCNVGAYVWDLTSNATPHFYIDTMGNTETTYIAYITLPSTTDDNLLITCAAKLINPIRYPITHQALKTLRGINNIWSTSNGPISIEYWKH